MSKMISYGLIGLAISKLSPSDIENIEPESGLEPATSSLGNCP